MTKILAGCLAVSLLVNGAAAGLIAGYLLTGQHKCHCDEKRPPRRFPTGWQLPDDSDKLPPRRPTGDAQP